MGTIHPELRSGHLSKKPEEDEFIRPFLNGFDVTWANLRRAANTELSVYFLKPEQYMERGFGFEAEILLAYSKYDTLEPRVVQAIDQILADLPAKGRVDTMTVFLVSEASDPDAWINRYVLSNPESRIFAAFSAAKLRASKGDSNYVRNTLAEQLYQRDLFDHRLPLRSDSYFFGRADIVFDFFNAIRSAENRGLFGLRKTGKTSLLYKIERRVEAASAGKVLFYDCKFPGLRSCHWEELLDKIASDLRAVFNLGRKILSAKTAADRFVDVIASLDETARVALVFDEIEYISPHAKLDPHWSTEFVPFWQTLWACQSRHRNVSVIIAGVNPSVVEQDSVDGVQNPLFGIVPAKYLQGLLFEEVKTMLRILGRPMGIRFDDSAVDYIWKRYGGHPLLTRIACSLTHQAVYRANIGRPFELGAEFLQERETVRDAELTFYCCHVVSELREFYKDEYALLEKIACGEIADYVEMAMMPEFASHLFNYGLLDRVSAGRPQITIPVVGRYLGLEAARREGRRTLLRVVPAAERMDWLERRVQSIDTSLAALERGIERSEAPGLFGTNSYPESHKFFAIDVCDDERIFSEFINTMNRCFVESIESYGRSLGAGNYFWQTIKGSYPALWEALNRIKLYRHNRVHLKLNPGVDLMLQQFLRLDLEQRNPAQVEDLWFVLQQCVLDGLLTSLLIELDRLN